MSIEFTLTGVCVDEARTLLGTFCKRELTLERCENSAYPTSSPGEAPKFFFLSCAVDRHAASGAFLLDRAYGKQKVAELLVEIKKTAVPGDSIAMSVQGRDDLDLIIAQPSSVYSAFAHGAKPLPKAGKP